MATFPLGKQRVQFHLSSQRCWARPAVNVMSLSNLAVNYEQQRLQIRRGVSKRSYVLVMWTRTKPCRKVGGLSSPNVKIQADFLGSVVTLEINPLTEWVTFLVLISMPQLLLSLNVYIVQINLGQIWIALKEIKHRDLEGKTYGTWEAVARTFYTDGGNRCLGRWIQSRNTLRLSQHHYIIQSITAFDQVSCIWVHCS